MAVKSLPLNSSGSPLHCVKVQAGAMAALSKAAESDARDGELVRIKSHNVHPGSLHELIEIRSGSS